MDLHVATSNLHVSVTSRRRLPTARREFVQASVTSRRCPAHRDVGFITLCDAATSPRTSRRCPVLSPRTVHFWLFTSHTPNPNPSFPCAPALTGPVEAFVTLVGGPSIVLRPSLCSYEPPSSPGSGSLWHFPPLCSVLAFGSPSRVPLYSRVVSGSNRCSFRVFFGLV